MNSIEVGQYVAIIRRGDSVEWRQVLEVANREGLPYRAAVDGSYFQVLVGSPAAWVEHRDVFRTEREATLALAGRYRKFAGEWLGRAERLERSVGSVS